jgi:hypothetical protein
VVRERFSVDDEDAILPVIPVGAAIVDKPRYVEMRSRRASKISVQLRRIRNELLPISAVRVDGPHERRKIEPEARERLRCSFERVASNAVRVRHDAARDVAKSVRELRPPDLGEMVWIVDERLRL